MRILFHAAAYFLACLVASASASLSTSVYSLLTSFPCVRLLNATTTIGCQTLSSISGILYSIATMDDLGDFLLWSSTNEKYAIVMPYGLLNSDILSTLRLSNRLAGVIAVVNGSVSSPILDRPPSFSPDSPCPNCEFGLYANDSVKYIWNPNGTGLLYESFDFPIFALNPIDQLSTTMYDAIIGNLNVNMQRNYTFPLKAVDFNEFMWAAVDSETCLRRGWCQPVGGVSIYSTPSVNMSSNDGKPIVVVSAPLDSKSLFHDLTFGIENSISSIVGLMAIADALSNSPIPLDTFPKHILYTFFSGESWAFAGSSRFVQDLTTFQCLNTSTICNYASTPCTYPCVHDIDFTRINFDKIDSLWHLDAIAQSSSSMGPNNTVFYLHVDDAKLSAGLVGLVNEVSEDKDDGYSVEAANADGNYRGLPPSSVMSFLKVKRSIPAIVVSDYQSALDNFYNSDFDDTFNFSAVSSAICYIANVTARAIWLQAQDLPSSNASTIPASVSANCTLVETLLDCLANNISCDYTQNFFNVSNASRISHYLPVFNYRSNIAVPALFAFTFMANVTAASRSGSCELIGDCDAGNLCIAKRCVISFTRYHDAYGTGLTLAEDGTFKVIDPINGGTWTESTWSPIGFRVFQVISFTSQIIELLVGVLWTAVSIIAVIVGKIYLKKTLKVA